MKHSVVHTSGERPLGVRCQGEEEEGDDETNRDER